MNLNSDGDRILTQMLMEADGHLCFGRPILCDVAKYKAVAVPFAGLS